MSTAASSAEFGAPATGEARETADAMASLWWVWLLVGIAWVIGALVVLQFDEASIVTIGVVVGVMFVASGLQQFVVAATVDHLRWLWALFGVLFLVAGVVCFINPKETFAGLADILGFLFLTVGIWWVIRAFIERGVNPVWWLTLLSGVLMIIVAFWTSGQFFIEKAYTLLVFAGIWALMHGTTDIVRAFAVRSLRGRI
jgi:uncharacterized membrane protein HdeD (DUF308 family)